MLFKETLITPEDVVRVKTRDELPTMFANKQLQLMKSQEQIDTIVASLFKNKLKHNDSTDNSIIIPRSSSDENIVDDNVVHVNNIYQVQGPEGLTNRFVKVIEVHNDGISICSEIFEFSPNGSPRKLSNNKVMIESCLLKEPSIYPTVSDDADSWIRFSSQGVEKAKEIASSLISGYFCTVGSLNTENDVIETVNAVKTLLKGRIGGFFLTLLLSFLTKKLKENIKEKTKLPIRQDNTKKLSEMSTLFKRNGSNSEKNEKDIRKLNNVKTTVSNKKVTENSSNKFSKFLKK